MGLWGVEQLPPLLAVKPCTEDGTKQFGSFSQENLHPTLWGGGASVCQPVLAEYKPASSPILRVTYAGCKHKCMCPHSDTGEEPLMQSGRGREQKTSPNVLLPGGERTPLV